MINGPAIARDVLRPETPDQPETLVLAVSKRTARPIYYAGNLRIAALPPGMSVPASVKTAGAALMLLEVTAEPLLRWQKPVGLRITRAVDDQEQVLAQLPTTFAKPANASPQGTVTMIVNGVPVEPEGSKDEVQRHVPVRLQLGAKPAKVLKELNGTIAAQVQSPVQPLVMVEDLARAVGETVKGAGGAWVKVTEVSRQEDGQVKLKFQVEAPPSDTEDGSAALAGNAVVVINGKVMGQKESLSALNFALRDDKGRPFQTVKATDTGRRAGRAQEYEFVYKPGEGRGEPAKFVYSGRRTAIIEVPFTLKNVPLE
jgi:hypothetical protein